jgi:hypothetical protein
MKNSILFLLICTILVSCTKENVLPSQTQSQSLSAANSENAIVQPVVIFNSAIADTVHISQGLNILQTDSVSVNGSTAYVSRFLFIVTGSPHLTNFRFYINGGQIGATITYSNDTIIVAPRRLLPLATGSYNYILRAKASGISGSSFSLSLTSAIIVDAKRFMANIQNLPKASTHLIFN